MSGEARVRCRRNRKPRRATEARRRFVAIIERDEIGDFLFCFYDVIDVFNAVIFVCVFIVILSWVERERDIGSLWLSVGASVDYDWLIWNVLGFVLLCARLSFYWCAIHSHKL